MKNKILFISLAVVLLLSVGLIGCTGDGTPVGPPTDKIYAFAPRSLTGSLETIGDFAFGPVMDYWQDKVNTAGGINVGGTIGTKMVDLTIVDDTSDLGLMSSLLSSAILSNDYHFMFPPCSTSFLQSAAGTCSGAGYVLVGAEGGCTTIEQTLANYKYLFATLTYSTWAQMDSLFEILRDWQVNGGAPGDTLAPDPMEIFIMYIGDTHGWEYRDACIAAIDADPTHFTLAGTANVPVGEANVLTQLQAAQTSGADLLCSFCYPPAAMTTVSMAIANSIEFDSIIVGPGMNFEFMLLPPVSGVNRNLDLQGVMGFTTFNEESLDNVGGDAANFTADFVDFFSQAAGTKVTGTTRDINGETMGRFIMDWWGTMPYVAGLEILQSAIETTNSLDNDVIRAELAKGPSAKFSTTFGDAWFVQADGVTAPGANSGGLLCQEFYHGQIGQWQYDAAAAPYGAPPSGVFPSMEGCPGWMIYEVIDVVGGTADGLYPKPNWGYNCS